MKDIKFSCPSCGQPFEAAPDLAGQSIECPTCKQTTRVPVVAGACPVPPALPQPVVPPAGNRMPRIPPVATYCGPPAKRHGIFYYVFWGTVSLCVTLLILGFILIFGASFGVGFVGGLRGNAPPRDQTAPSVAPMLPPLTERQATEAKRLLPSMRVSKDEIEGITWLTPRVADGNKTAVFLYIGQKGADPWLRWTIRYCGDQWLFVERCRIKVDQAEPFTLLPAERVSRDHQGGSVCETLDEPAASHIASLNQILGSQRTYVRMEGRDGIWDIELGSADIQQMRDVLLVFRSLGGKWPFGVGIQKGY